MSIVYQKWRDLIINPFNIKFNCIKINRIISYPPAGNDVVECLCEINGDVKNIFIKIERSKVCDFTTEVNNLNYLKSNNADKEAKTKLLNTQMEDYKADKAAYIRKIKEMQNEISAMQTIHKQKDSEIKSLVVQLNTLRQLLKNANVNQIDIDISNYINSIKKENYDLEPSEDGEKKSPQNEDNKPVQEMVDLGIQKTTNENNETFTKLFIVFSFLNHI